MSATELALAPNTGPIERAIQGFESMDSASLRAELSRSLDRTASELVRLAAIVRVLEARGEDLSGLKLGLIGYLRQIAYGRLAPELVVRYAEQPSILRVLGSLPAPDQARVVQGDPVPLVVRVADGTFTTRLVDPAKLTRSQVSQVFAGGRIRDEAEQVLRLEGQPATGPRRQVASVYADRKRGIIRVGRNRVTVDEVLEALGQLRDNGPDDDQPNDDQPSTLPVQITQGEHRRLRVLASERGLTMGSLVRRALFAAGLVGSPPSE